MELHQMIKEFPPRDPDDPKIFLDYLETHIPGLLENVMDSFGVSGFRGWLTGFYACLTLIQLYSLPDDFDVFMAEIVNTED